MSTQDFNLRAPKIAAYRPSRIRASALARATRRLTDVAPSGRLAMKMANAAKHTRIDFRLFLFCCFIFLKTGDVTSTCQNSNSKRSSEKYTKQVKPSWYKLKQAAAAAAAAAAAVAAAEAREKQAETREKHAETREKQAEEQLRSIKERKKLVEFITNRHFGTPFRVPKAIEPKRLGPRLN